MLPLFYNPTVIDEIKGREKEKWEGEEKKKKKKKNVFFKGI